MYDADEPVHAWNKGDRVVVAGTIVQAFSDHPIISVKLDGVMQTIPIHHEHLCEQAEAFDVEEPGFNHEWDLGH